jgi:hypothetical protein
MPTEYLCPTPGLGPEFVGCPRSWAFPDLWPGPPWLGPDCFIPRRTNLVKEYSILLEELATLKPFKCRASDWKRTVLNQRYRKHRDLSFLDIFKWYDKTKVSNVNNACGSVCKETWSRAIYRTLKVGCFYSTEGKLRPSLL